MKTILIHIQNFFLTLGRLIRHPVDTADIVMRYRNSEDLKRDIDAINKERIESLYQIKEAPDTESKKKEYQRINESFQKRMIFHVGFGAGLFSELDSLMEHMLFCFINHIRFEIYADDANFSKPGGKGWEELFEPFCPINHDKLNHVANYRPTDYQSYMRKHRLWIKGELLPRILKRRTGADYLTQDIWCMCTNKEFKNTHLTVPLFGIDGPGALEFTRLSEIALCPKPDVRAEMDALIAGLKLPEHYISMQVRGGDKLLEHDELIGLDRFISCLEHMNLEHRNIFLFTDDYTNVEQLREKRPDWNVYTLTRKEERGYYNSEFNKADWEYRRSNIVKLLAIMEVCVGSDLHIGSKQSCVDSYLRSKKGDTRYRKAIEG